MTAIPIKKVFRWLATLLIVLAGIVIARTLTSHSRQLSVVEIEVMPLDEEALLARFARSLTFRTVSSQDGAEDAAAFHSLHAFLRASFPLVHDALESETVSELSLLYTWPGSEAELDPIVLMGHLDVVPVSPGTEGNWEHPPYDGVIADGFVWGRGSLDDKLAVLAILEAAEALLRDGFQPRRTIYLAFGHDEEQGGGEGAQLIAEQLAQRGVQRLAMVLDEGGVITSGQIPGISGPVAVVGIAEKGSVTLTLRVEGRGGHASTPPEQTNIGILARAITRLENDPFPLQLQGAVRSMFDFAGPEMSFGMRLVFANLWLFEPLVESIMGARSTSRALLHTTTATTIIEGGFKSNALPSNASAEVNFRIVPGDTPEGVAERVRAVIDDDRVEVLGAEGGRPPSPVSDTDSPAFDTLSRTIKEVIGSDVLVAPFLVLPGTDSRHFTGLSTNVYRFLPTRFEEEDMRRVHGTNERVPTGSYLDSVRFFYRLIRNVDEMP